MVFVVSHVYAECFFAKMWGKIKAGTNYNSRSRKKTIVRQVKQKTTGYFCLLTKLAL